MNIPKVRKTFTEANGKLRKGRYEYINERRHDIMISKDNKTINRVALEMVALGLYAKPSRSLRTDNALRDFRFAICRTMWRIDISIWGKDKIGDWWLWLNRNGFDYNFGKIANQRRTA